MLAFGVPAMRIMAASYLFCGFSTMIATYFQAVGRVGASMGIQLCRQLLFLAPVMWGLERWIHLDGVWLAFPAAEAAALAAALALMARRHENVLACTGRKEER